MSTGAATGVEGTGVISGERALVSFADGLCSATVLRCRCGRILLVFWITTQRKIATIKAAAGP